MNSKSLLKVAGVALVIHGAIELLGLFSFFTGEPPNFIFQEIKTNWQQAVIVGVIAGAVRIVAAVGIFRIRRWGVVLGMVQSAITLTTLTFYLPFGVIDAALSSIALVALVMVWWGKEKQGSNPS
jgi:hypothetical protein